MRNTSRVEQTQNKIFKLKMQCQHTIVSLCLVIGLYVFGHISSCLIVGIYGPRQPGLVRAVCQETPMRTKTSERWRKTGRDTRSLFRRLLRSCIDTVVSMMMSYPQGPSDPCRTDKCYQITLLLPRIFR